MSKVTGKAIYRVKAPAKINIGLRILSKRKDDYHNLETIFYPVKLYDDIRINIEKLPADAKRNIIKVISHPVKNISGTRNICFRAAVLFFEKFRIKDKYRITIDIKKNIPLGAGLGGGSSDAACMLKILMRHFKVKGKPNEMITFAQDVGSDVPFFLIGKAAYAEGRGEKLTPLSKFKVNGKILLVNPGIHISTPRAFKELGIESKKKKLIFKVTGFDVNDERLMINDFERVVFRKYPKIEKIKYDMYKLGASYSLMSGSGSTVYGIFKPKDIDAAEKYFKEKKYKVFIG